MEPVYRDGEKRAFGCEGRCRFAAGQECEDACGWHTFSRYKESEDGFLWFEWYLFVFSDGGGRTVAVGFTLLAAK
jgi:hypothetical protein